MKTPKNFFTKTGGVNQRYFDYIKKFGTFKKESTWSAPNEIIPADIYEVDGVLVKKCYPSWTRNGFITIIDNI